MGGAALDGVELRPSVTVKLYFDGYWTSGDDADTCAITIEILDDVAATTMSWVDAGIALDHVGIATSGAMVALDHTCGSEPWAEDAVAMFGSYDWWVGFGNPGPDITLTPEDAESFSGGSASWSRLEDRGRYPTSWNLSSVYQLENTADGPALSTDAYGEAILLPSDRAGTTGWYEIESQWLFWPSYLF